MPGPDLDAYIDSSAAALGIGIDPSWKPEVRANLEITLRLARVVAEFPLSDEAEPAPVYRAGE